MISPVVFVTGTDTGIGKTYASIALIRALRAAGRRVMPMKPVASGCEVRDGARVNEDALQLIEACGSAPDYAAVNPYALLAPVSPHIAAAAEAVRIEVDRIVAAAGRLSRHADMIVAEGAGGWLSPIDEGLWQSDIARALAARVVLVVGLRLGCINHALLSARAVRADGFALAGWIGNAIDPHMACAEAVFDTLMRELPMPCLGRIPWRGPAEIDAGPLLADDAGSMSE